MRKPRSRQIEKMYRNQKAIINFILLSLKYALDKLIEFLIGRCKVGLIYFTAFKKKLKFILNQRRHRLGHLNSI